MDGGVREGIVVECGVMKGGVIKCGVMDGGVMKKKNGGWYGAG